MGEQAIDWKMGCSKKLRGKGYKRRRGATWGSSGRIDWDRKHFGDNQINMLCTQNLQKEE